LVDKGKQRKSGIADNNEIMEKIGESNMVDSRILESEWVEPKKNGWGHQLKPGAPESVKREFENFQKALETHRNEDES